MSNYDIALLVPSIRTNKLPDFIQSIYKACKNYSWQLVLVSPFELPEELQANNIKVIQDFGCVTRCVQIGMLECNSDNVYFTVDDYTLAEDSLDVCLKQYIEECRKVDVLSCRFGEAGYIYTAEDLRAWHHDQLHLKYVKPDWNIALQPLLNKSYFIELGGLDCQFEYLSESLHHLMFRIQMLGGRVIMSKTHIATGTHYPHITGDHAAVHYACEHDSAIFRQMFTEGNIQTHINYENWKTSPPIWGRRFTRGTTSSYKELIEQEGYTGL